MEGLGPALGSRHQKSNTSHRLPKMVNAAKSRLLLHSANSLSQKPGMSNAQSQTACLDLRTHCDRIAFCNVMPAPQCSPVINWDSF
jgi:hypothetical protein